jgi:glucose/arabinose dehydrogenase
MSRSALPLIAAGIFAILAVAQDEFTKVEVVGHIVRPEKIPPNPHDELVKAPEGFRVARFAADLGKPRMLAVSDDGTLYVTRREQGDVLLLRDEDDDGRAEMRQTALVLPEVHGIAIHEKKVFLATVKEVYAAEIQADGKFNKPVAIIRDLPDGGQHPNRTLAVGPDGMLYITVGSTCNACKETNAEHATMIRTKLDGSGREVFAKGLRNTLGFGWHPESGTLFGLDHGIDWLGDNEQVEELNVLEQGKHYGWPWIYADGKRNPADPLPPEMKGTTFTSPVLGYVPHSAPMQMVFYTGDQFPAEFKNDAFVAMRGSWNRQPPSGYEVVRVRFKDAKPVKIEPFLTGFLQGDATRWGYIGRPVGLAMAPSGTLFVGDDSNGVIYRVTYDRGGVRSRSR